MNNRNKIYYPDSQIEKNLFTQGREWMLLENWSEYRGPYHRYITGETFTGADWNIKTSKKLVRYRERTETFFEYVDTKNYINKDGNKIPIISSAVFNVSRYRAPRAVKRKASDQDLAKGYMTRYFIYKRNEPNRVFFEISEEQSKTYTSSYSGINKNLYDLVEFKWKLDGPEYDVYNDAGILLESGVFDTNKRIILRNSKKFPKLADIVTDFFEYTVYQR